MFDLQRNACLRFVVQPHVNEYKAPFGKLQSLDVDDEIARDKMRIVRKSDGDEDFDGRHDALVIGVDQFGSIGVRPRRRT